MVCLLKFYKMYNYKIKLILKNRRKRNKKNDLKFLSENRIFKKYKLKKNVYFLN